jgi:hypothetical protein
LPKANLQREARTARPFCSDHEEERDAMQEGRAWAVEPGHTEPAAGLVAVDVRRERSRNEIVRFRGALVYVDGEQVTAVMNGAHVVFYLRPGMHRIGVSTQFDPVVELQFLVTADPRYANRASVTFNEDHRVMPHRVAQ